MKYEIDVDDPREYNTKFEFTEVTDKAFAHKTWPQRTSVAGESLFYVINPSLNNKQLFIQSQSLQEIALGQVKL